MLKQKMSACVNSAVGTGLSEAVGSLWAHRRSGRMVSHPCCGSPWWGSSAEPHVCSQIPVSDSVMKFLVSDLFKIATAPWHDLLKGWHNKAVCSKRALCYLCWRQDVSEEQPWGVVFKDVVSWEHGRDQASWKVSHFVTITECAFFANWEYICCLLCCYVMSVAYIFWHWGWETLFKSNILEWEKTISLLSLKVNCSVWCLSLVCPM